jgi:glucose/arabinose dehydrogenase
VSPPRTFYTAEEDYNFTNQAKSCGELTSTCYPTVAPSSLRLYTSNVIPDWQNSLLTTTLKAGMIFQIALDENGTALAREPVELFLSENRYRNIAFDPDGRTLYVINDSLSGQWIRGVDCRRRSSTNFTCGKDCKQNNIIRLKVRNYPQFIQF